VIAADAGLERIKRLEERLAAAPVNSLYYRTLSAAIGIEADAYRKSLDSEQAKATHDARPQTAVRPGSLLFAVRKQTVGRKCASGIARPRR
jgi:hypothetical protein